MNPPDKDLSLGVEDALLVFRDLEEYVVCLDRIISRIGAGEDPEILVRYIADRRMTAGLARAREVVGDALQAVVGAEALEELAEGVYRYSGP